jgi:hypothetical protein
MEEPSYEKKDGFAAALELVFCYCEGHGAS